MTQEEKDLLLKDLCARLPYGVKCQIKGEESLEPVTLKSYMNCDPIFAFDFYLEENSSLAFKDALHAIVAITSLLNSLISICASFNTLLKIVSNSFVTERIAS